MILEVLGTAARGMQEATPVDKHRTTLGLGFLRLDMNCSCCTHWAGWPGTLDFYEVEEPEKLPRHEISCPVS